MIINMNKCQKVLLKKEDRYTLYYSYVATFLLVMVAHGFAFFNFYPGHDSIRHSFYYAGKWEVSLSRFLLPYYGLIKGSIAVPWLTGIFTILFGGAATFFICDSLDICDKKCIFIVSGVLGTNLSVTELCRVFMFVLDAYMLAMMFACMGVWIIHKKTNLAGMLVGIVCFTVSMGLYSGMIPVALLLFILIVIKNSLNNCEVKQVLLHEYLFYVVSLLAGAILFMVCSKLFMKIWSVEPAQSYNSISSLKSLNCNNLILGIKQNFLFWLNFYFGKANPVSSLLSVFNIILLLICIWIAIQSIRYRKISIINIVIVSLCMIMFPGISMLINILMQETENNFYCNFALCLFYIPIIKAIDFSLKRNTIQVKKCIDRVAVICFVLIFWNNIVYSNGAYTVQKVLYDRAVSDMTRILHDIESDEEFDLGSTEVIFVRAGDENIQSPTNAYDVFSGGKKMAFSTNNSIKAFIELIGDPIIVVNDNSVIDEYKEMESVKDMPSFPQRGYFKMINGKMIVKIKNT